MNRRHEQTIPPFLHRIRSAHDNSSKSRMSSELSDAASSGLMSSNIMEVIASAFDLSIETHRQREKASRIPRLARAIVIYRGLVSAGVAEPLVLQKPQP